MPNTNYRKRARLERLARPELERQGYVVIRAAGSKGPCDLVALNKHEILLIQVKAEGAVRPADRQKLADMPAPGNAVREIWERTRQGTWHLQKVTPRGKLW
jgi:hypothetical protein